MLNWIWPLWEFETCDLVDALQDKWQLVPCFGANGEVGRVNPLGTTNVCAKFHVNLLDIFVEIFQSVVDWPTMTLPSPEPRMQMWLKTKMFEFSSFCVTQKVKNHRPDTFWIFALLVIRFKFRKKQFPLLIHYLKQQALEKKHVAEEQRMNRKQSSQFILTKTYIF